MRPGTGLRCSAHVATDTTEAAGVARSALVAPRTSATVLEQARAAPAPADAGSPRQRLAGLDGVRGLAALFVVVNHVFLRAFPGYPGTAHRSGPPGSSTGGSRSSCSSCCPASRWPWHPPATAGDSTVSPGSRGGAPGASSRRTGPPSPSASRWRGSSSLRRERECPARSRSSSTACWCRTSSVRRAQPIVLVDRRRGPAVHRVPAAAADGAPVGRPRHARHRDAPRGGSGRPGPARRPPGRLRDAVSARPRGAVRGRRRDRRRRGRRRGSQVVAVGQARARRRRARARVDLVAGLGVDARPPVLGRPRAGTGGRVSPGRSGDRPAGPASSRCSKRGRSATSARRPTACT